MQSRRTALAVLGLLFALILSLSALTHAQETIVSSDQIRTPDFLQDQSESTALMKPFVEKAIEHKEDSKVNRIIRQGYLENQNTTVMSIFIKEVVKDYIRWKGDRRNNLRVCVPFQLGSIPLLTIPFRLHTEIAP